jgi:hypothetical protein
MGAQPENAETFRLAGFNAFDATSRGFYIVVVIGRMAMKLTSDSYIIRMGTKNFTERYYRDKTGWLKVSARGRKFRMTAEQVLNHLLPAFAGVKPNLIVKVEHHDDRRKKKPSARSCASA